MIIIIIDLLSFVSSFYVLLNELHNYSLMYVFQSKMIQTFCKTSHQNINKLLQSGFMWHTPF